MSSRLRFDTRHREPSVWGSIQRGDPPDGWVDLVYKEPVGFRLNTNVQVRGDLRYASGEVVLGSYTAYTETVDGQQSTLFVPDRLDMAASPEEVITALAATERTIEGDPYQDTNLFVIEGQLGAGGAGGSSAVVQAGSPLKIYVHEFAHVNEGATFDRKMAWFTEASATYYENDFEVADGRLRIQRAKVLERTDPDDSWPRGDHYNESTLAEPNTWGYKADYRKGARLLFALDAKIRAATDGEATIHDVMRRVNQFDETYGALHYADFREIIVDLADEETASWLEPHVMTSQNPPRPNASAFGTTPEFTDGPTNMSGDARETVQLPITVPSGEQQGLESVTLAINAGETTVEAVASDGNNDGRVDVRFQPYGPDDGAVLEPVDSADEVTVTAGTLEEPLAAESVRIDLLLVDRSTTHRLSTRYLSLETGPTVPAESESTSTTTPTATRESNLSSEIPFLSQAQLIRLLGIISAVVVAVVLLEHR